MALTKTLENDKIEVVKKWFIQVRTASVIKEDGVELTRSFSRKVFNPGTLDANDNLIDTDISGEDQDVQAICNAAWTSDVKASWKAKLIADKSNNLGM